MLFVVTKRVFLNVLTQLMDAQTLVDANYYIADQASKDGNSGTGANSCEEYYYNDKGELCSRPFVMIGSSNLTPYHVTYNTGVMDPTKLNSQILTSTLGRTPFESYHNMLISNEGLLDTYQFLYEKKPVGNEQRFLIFTRDTSLPYMHIVCEYISRYFGEDVVFVDREYRSDVPGNVNYTGDRENAMSIFPKIRVYKTLKNIEELVTDYQYNVKDRANLETYFSVLPIEELFRLHEILFPHDPLQPGNYTQDQVAYIITEKLIERSPKLLNNTFTIEDISGLYDGMSDDELMSING